MNKGFTKADRKKITTAKAKIVSELEKLIEFLEEKHEGGEEFYNSCSEKWQEREEGESYSDWLGELDYKKDEIETLKDEIEEELEELGEIS